MTNKTIRIKGSELRSGDILHVWWSNAHQKEPNRAIITRIESYKGDLKHLFTEGASIAYFVCLRTGMTIDHSDYYDVDRG
jgi:hypothetical protein